MTTVLTWLAGVLALSLFAYLVVALLWPESLS